MPKGSEFDLQNWKKAKEGDIILCSITASIESKNLNEGYYIIHLNNDLYYSLSKIIVIYDGKNIHKANGDSIVRKKGIYPRITITNLKVIIHNNELSYAAVNYNL